MATTTFSTVTIPPGGTSGNVREGEEEGREGGWVRERRKQRIVGKEDSRER